MRHAFFAEVAPGGDLHRRSLRGGAVAMIAQAGNMVVQVISTIVLARILLPEDFGLVAMVTAMTGYASIIVDLGTRDAVAQRGRVDEGEVSALFWITFGVGLLFTAITAVSAPFVARLYHDPRLTYVAMAMSLTFVIPAVFFQQYALMRRALMFRTLAMIDVGSTGIATALAILMAYRGYGYWALVWKPVVAAAAALIGVWITCGWWPKRPTFNSGVKELLGFGLNVIGFSVADYIAKAADRVALGYTTGARELGYYQNAFTIYDSAMNICVALHNVATATLSKLRADNDSLKRAWAMALSSLTYFAAPGFAILAVIGQDLVVLLLGDKWKTAGAIVSILALRGPAHVVERTNGWLHIAAGRPERWRHWGIFSCIATIATLFCGLPFGAMGVAVAYTVLMYVLFVPSLVYAGKPLGIHVADVLKTVGPQVATALVTAGVGFLLRYTLFQHTSPLARLLSLVLLCAVLYLGTMTLVFRMTKPLAVAVSLVFARRSSAV